MATNTLENLLEKQICLELHFRGVPQKNMALFLGKSTAHINEILKPLGKRSQDGDE